MKPSPTAIDPRARALDPRGDLKYDSRGNPKYTMLIYPCPKCGNLWAYEVGAKKTAELRCWDCDHVCWSRDMPTVTHLLNIADRQRRAGTRKSGEVRKLKNLERDRRIHDSAAEGILQKAIALDEEVTESIVSRVLKKPRP